MRPEIEQFEGNDVIFKDGTRETVDTIIFATGYKLAIPFLAEKEYLGPNGKPRLYKNVAHPEHPGLFFAGLIQANGSIWRLADYQGQIIANAILAEQTSPADAAKFRAKVSAPTPVSNETFVESERHKLEANYFDYARDLKREVKAFGKFVNAQQYQKLETTSAPAHIEAKRHAAE